MDNSPDNARVALEPCPNPWCPQPSGNGVAHNKREGWRVLCNCGVATPRFDSRDEAVSTWNTRPALAERATTPAEGDVDRLRKALIECGRHGGAILADDVSTDFLMQVPEEVRLMVAALQPSQSEPDHIGGAGISHGLFEPEVGEPGRDMVLVPREPTEADVHRVARAICDRVNGQGDYDDNPVRHPGWNAQARIAIATFLTAATPSKDAADAER